MTVVAPVIALALATSAQKSSAQLGAEPAKDDIAAQIRAQGFACDTPLSAQRDSARSRPDEPVWILECEHQSYRVRLVPDQAAKVERLG
ncbi:MAG: hypothetical protein ACLFU3_05615 [Dichotomicrobium sp.]